MVDRLALKSTSPLIEGELLETRFIEELLGLVKKGEEDPTHHPISRTAAEPTSGNCGSRPV